MYKIKLVNGGIIASARTHYTRVLGENTIYFSLCYNDESTVVTKLDVKEVLFTFVNIALERRLQQNKDKMGWKVCK